MKLQYKIFIGILILTFFAGGIYIWQSNLLNSQSKVETFKQPKSDSPKINPTKDEPTNITFLAVGDIMLSRNVAGTMAKNNKDINYPFRNMASVLSSTDFNFANLESPFSGKDSFNPTGSLVFNAPTWTLPSLGKYKFEVLNLANNHAFDQGKDGLLYTKKLLTDSGLLPLGVGNNLNEAWQGQVYTVKGVRVGFVGASYSSINDGGIANNNYVARIEDTIRLKNSITDLKAKSDFVVATMHAGTEYTRTPNASQTAFARAAIDAGADIVIGAHPHWIQTFEKYKGKYIFYSLGNFVFDQEWSRDTKEGLALKITLQKASRTTADITGTTSLQEIDLMPVIIENYSAPRLANEIEKQAILKKISADNEVVK